MKVKKVNVVNEYVIDYGGGFDESDVERITKGYHYNGLFYTRKNSKYFFIVEPD